MVSIGFLIEKGYPLFVSEWGVDLSHRNENEGEYLNCFLGWAAQHDLDWALWGMTGSYYYREKVAGMEEFYGLLDSDWARVRNSNFLDKISEIQVPHQGPTKSGIKSRQKIIYHPSTGLCVIRKSLKEITLGKCSESNHLWSYTPQKTITTSPYFCLKAQGPNQPIQLSTFCLGTGTSWEPISDSKLHLSTNLLRNSGSTTTLCMDVDSSNNVITTKCKCVDGDKSCDPVSQWFQIADVNIDTFQPRYDSNVGSGPSSAPVRM